MYCRYFRLAHSGAVEGTLVLYLNMCACVCAVHVPLVHHANIILTLFQQFTPNETKTLAQADFLVREKVLSELTLE